MSTHNTVGARLYERTAGLLTGWWRGWTSRRRRRLVSAEVSLLRDENAALREELREEKARLNDVISNCWRVHQGNVAQYAVYHGGEYITPWLPSARAAVDAARAALEGGAK